MASLKPFDFKIENIRLSQIQGDLNEEKKDLMFHFVLPCLYIVLQSILYFQVLLLTLNFLLC